MRHYHSARWLMPALLLSVIPMFSYAEVFKGVGIAPHMLPAYGQPQTQADATPAAQPQTPAKTPANRKHLNVSVGPVKMHLPVSGKRPVAANGPTNGNSATGSPDLVHPVQQPLGQPSDLQQVQATSGAQGQTGSGSAQPNEQKTRPFTIKGNDQQAYQPPQAIAPATETSFREADAHKPITFRWTPVIPKPQGPVTYRMSVWQLMQGQTGAQAMKANQPILTKLADEPSLDVSADIVTGPCLPPYLCDYVWNVQALNRDGKPIGENHGLSETAGFRFDSRARTFLEQQPNGAGNESRKKGVYTMGLNLSFDRVQPAGPGAQTGAANSPEQPASEGIYDRWGDGPGPVGSGLTQKPAPGGPGTGAPAQIDIGIASGGVHRQVTPGAAMKANTPIITKDVDNLHQADAAGMRPRENGGVVGYGTQQKSAPNEGILVINPNDVDSIDQTKSPNSGRERPAVANGVVIITTKKGVGGKPAAVDLEGGQLKQNPGYVRVGENPATGTNGSPQTRSDAIKGNAPILEGSDLHLRKSSGTPPIESMKANTPIITKDVGNDETRIQNPVLDGHSIKANQPILTKDVDEQPAASGSGSATRSLAAPGSGPVKPQPADNPITAINITLPANPDAAEKVNNPASGGTGAKPVSPGISDRWGNTVVTDGTMTLKKVPLQPGQERDIINKGLPITNKNIVRTEPNVVKDATVRGPVNQLNAPAPLNQNGKAGSQLQTPGTPVASHPESRTVTTDKLQGPEGAGMHASPTPQATAAPLESTPQAKPAKKKSKMSVHVVF